MELIITLLQDVGIVLPIAVSLGGFVASLAWALTLFVGKQS